MGTSKSKVPASSASGPSRKVKKAKTGANQAAENSAVEAEAEAEDVESEAGGVDEDDLGAAEVSDDEAADDVDAEGKTEEELNEERKRVAKMKARRRGYRTVAKKGGFASDYDSGFSHLDVATPILSDAEVIRACKWAPKVFDKAAYDGIEEFEERTRLSLQSLPPSAARVIRMHGETYIRRLAVGSMQRASDAQKTSVKITQVQAETRPLQRVQKYSFVSPKGLVRYAQGEAPLERLSYGFDDVEEGQLKKDKALLKEQKASVARLQAEKKQEDVARVQAKAEAKAGNKCAA